MYRKPRSWGDLTRGYSRIFDVLGQDLERPNTDLNVYALDFSDLFLYMHQSRTPRYTYHALDFMLSNVPETDALTILPPTVYEILRYFEKLSSKLSRYQQHVRILKDKRVERFLEIGGEPESFHVKVIPEYTKMGSLATILSLATDAGYGFWVKHPMGKLVSLIEGRKIRPIDGVLDEHLFNESVYNTLMSGLTDLRPDAEESNMVDASVGAIVYEFGQKFYRSGRQHSNVLTGSPIPFSVMNQVVLQSDPQKMPIVRRAAYYPVRAMLHKYTKSREEQLYIVNSVRRTLDLLNSCSSTDELSRTLAGLIGRRIADHKGDFRADELSDLRLFISLFMFDYHWNDFIKETTKRLQEEIGVTALAKDILRDEKPKESDLIVLEKLAELPYEKIEEIKKALKYPQEYEEAVSRAQEALVRDMSDLYRKLYVFIRDSDAGALTPRMIDLYERIEARRA
jgi:hypothetical protein